MSWQDSPPPGEGFIPAFWQSWILYTGFWRDDGFWVDSPAVWRDYPRELWMDSGDPTNNWTDA